jgi:type IV pilus assembly protein PilA
MTPLQAYLNSPRARRALSKKPGEEGFSLIELVVVVAVLAVLSAIAIPQFNNISGKARAAAASNTLATVAKECAAKIADVGVANATFVIPGADGYKPPTVAAGQPAPNVGFFVDLQAYSAGQTVGCSETAVVELRSEDTSAYPTWIYNQGTGEKTCRATGAALNRGCSGNPGVW